jgi:hypothetical protein
VQGLHLLERAELGEAEIQDGGNAARTKVGRHLGLGGVFGF